MTLTLRALICATAVLAGHAAFADGDPAKGEKVFRKCKACHDIGDGAKDRVGPVLNGVIGRQAGTYEGFAYSDAMIAAGEGGLIWDTAALDAFLAKPKELVPGTKMTFAGLRKEDDREDVIAYIETFSGS